MFARWEWAIVELIVLAALLAELVSVRRSIKRDRAAQAARAPEPDMHDDRTAG